jgi:hypothetical protein
VKELAVLNMVSDILETDTDLEVKHGLKDVTDGIFCIR